MKTCVFAILTMLLSNSVCHALGGYGVLLGPANGPQVAASIEYPTTINEHAVIVTIGGGHASDDVQLQSDDLVYIVRAKVDGVVYSHVFFLPAVLPLGYSITSIEADVNLDDGIYNYFEYIPLNVATPDSAHPAITFQTSGGMCAAILGNKNDTVVVEAPGKVVVLRTNKGVDNIICDAANSTIFSGGGADLVYCNPVTTSDTLYAGSAADQTTVGIDTLLTGDDEWFPRTSW